MVVLYCLARSVQSRSCPAGNGSPCLGECFISPIVISLLILASALAFLVFWFRQTCEWLLRNQPPLESEEAMLEGERAPVRVFRQTLRDSLAGSAAPEVQLEALEQDFRAMRYLLRRTSPSRFVRHSRCERMLMLDFRVTRSALRLRSLVRRPDGQAAFERLYDILDYFTAILRRRLLAAVQTFELVPAFVGGGAQVTVCSYCFHVREPKVGEWIAARRFHQATDVGAVALSHGMCPDCYEHLVRPTLPRTIVNR